MTTSRIERYGYRLTVSVLIAAIGLHVGGFLLAAWLPEVTGNVDQSVVSPSDTATPIATPPDGSVPIGLQVMPDTECMACHLDPSGAIGVARATVLAHPLEGWKDCTACHADDRLVRTAPGHSGNPQGRLPGLPPGPGRRGHGSTATASSGRRRHVRVLPRHGGPLPTDMAGRNESGSATAVKNSTSCSATRLRALLPLPSVLPGG